MDIQTTLNRLKVLGLTQSQMAAEVGCSQSTISEMAAGKAGTTRPSFKTISGIQRLAEKHGVETESPRAPRRPSRKPPKVPD